LNCVCIVFYDVKCVNFLIILLKYILINYFIKVKMYVNNIRIIINKNELNCIKN